MRFPRGVFAAAIFSSSLLSVRAAHGECVKITNQNPLETHKNSILLKGAALSIAPLGEPDRTYGFKVVFDVERVWKGSVGERIEIYQDLNPEQAQFRVGASSYYLVTEITTLERRRFFGITGTTPAYAPVHCGLEDYSASETAGLVEALGPGKDPRKGAGAKDLPTELDASAYAVYAAVLEPAWKN
jgi:hypothetical protein